MKAEELMRFDWVHLVDDNTPRQVDWIRSGEVGLFWNKTVTPPYLGPIPLTPEILEKNGLVFMAGLWYLRTEERKPIQIVFKDNNVITLSINATPVPIGLKYVHQLQHALRLYGIEKTIEL